MTPAIKNRSVLAITLAITSVILIGCIYLVLAGRMEREDHLLLDLFFRIRGPVDPGNEIVLVALDRESAAQMRRKSTAWKRSDFADAIEKLSAAGVDLIAIDYLFIVPDSEPSEDTRLEKAIRDSANVILSSDISKENRAVPYSAFRNQEIGEGFLNVFPDEDGFLRKAPSLYAQKNETGDLLIDTPLSIQIAAARVYPNGPPSPDLSHPTYMQLGDLKIPYAGNHATDGFYINFTGPSGHFRRLHFSQIIRGDFSPKDLSGKIVLIGSMNPYFHDYYPVPFSGEESDGQKPMQSMYGVEIHANALHTLLNRTFLAPVPTGQLLSILIGAALIATAIAILPRWNPFLLAAAAVLLIALFFFTSYAIFLRHHLLLGTPVYIATFGIILTGTVARQMEEASERKYVTKLFGRYVAANIVEELISNRDLVQLRGRKQRLTMFFSDIRGFTSMSEKLPPEEVSFLLNEYFSRMTKIVFKHGGTLDKFMGDAIMAFFGNPIYFADHAARAVRMAVEMREAMKDLKNEWARKGKDYPVHVGMGINTGEVVVGNLGSEEFFDYTVIGDDVNLACRLEAIAKGGQIIVSAATYEEVKNQFEFRRLEPVTVKGKSQPVQIYEVV